MMFFLEQKQRRAWQNLNVLGVFRDFRIMVSFWLFAAPFFSMCRTFMILRALCYPDPRGAFTYFKRNLKCHRKFFTATLSQSTPSPSDLRHYIAAHLLADFGKMHTGLVFTAPFLFYVSHALELTCVVLPRPQRSSQILSSYPGVLQKIIYSDMKSVDTLIQGLYIEAFLVSRA